LVFCFHFRFHFHFIFRIFSGVGLWNLSNEPDLVSHPTTSKIGEKWVKRLANLIRKIDPVTPITCGLHTPSLREDVGFRVDEVFEDLDVVVMHGYPMYAPGWANHPLDPLFVPGLCALTSELVEKPKEHTSTENTEKVRPVIAEEFGGCTQSSSGTLCWSSYGQERAQFMASEEEFADYLRSVIAILMEQGVIFSLLNTKIFSQK
jgi:hypothetical protein